LETQNIGDAKYWRRKILRLYDKADDLGMHVAENFSDGKIVLAIMVTLNRMCLPANVDDWREYIDIYVRLPACCG